MFFISAVNKFSYVLGRLLYEFVYRCCSCDFDDIFVSAVDHFAAADGMYSSLLAAWHGSSIVRHIGKVTVHRSGLYCDG